MHALRLSNLYAPNREAQGRGLVLLRLFIVTSIMDKFYVYLLSNQHHTVFYTGFTDNLERRVYEHKNKLLKSFTNKYNIDKLLYYEEFSSAEDG
jgi:hypothetical protein